MCAEVSSCFGCQNRKLRSFGGRLCMSEHGKVGNSWYLTMRQASKARAMQVSQGSRTEWSAGDKPGLIAAPAQRHHPSHDDSADRRQLLSAGETGSRARRPRPFKLSVFLQFPAAHVFRGLLALHQVLISLRYGAGSNTANVHSCRVWGGLF